MVLEKVGGSAGSICRARLAASQWFERLCARVAAGEGMRPLPPCQLRIVPSAAGIDIVWVRRSRVMLGWGDGLDPAGGETYRVRVLRGSVERQWVTTVASLSVSTSDLAALGSGATVVAVAQLGERGTSHEISASITI